MPDRVSVWHGLSEAFRQKSMASKTRKPDMKGVLLIDDILPSGSYVGENLTRQPLAGEALPGDGDVLKIGRASCRERV